MVGDELNLQPRTTKMKSKPVKITEHQIGKRTVWKVRGTIRGERINKRFSCEDKAKAFAEAQELSRTAPVGRHTIDTHLSYPQIHDAERAIELLDGKGTLSDAVTSFLVNWVAKDRVISVGDAYGKYLEVRKLDLERKLIAKSTYRTSKTRISRFVSWLGKDTLVSSITHKTVKAFLDDHFSSARNYQNYRGALSHFIKWCVEEEYLANDVTLKIKSYANLVSNQRGLAETLSPADAEKLLRYVENYDGGSLVPFLTLTLFCGIRPYQGGEIGKVDFSKHVNLEAGTVSIPPDVSKVNNQRNTPIPANAIAWLRKYPCEGSPCAVNNFRRAWRKIRTDFGLTFDVLRHTAITYHLKQGNSLIETARIFGNSESILEKHYINANRTKEEAEKFFSILPLEESEGKVLKFA